MKLVNLFKIESVIFIPLIGISMFWEIRLINVTIFRQVTENLDCNYKLSKKHRFMSISGDIDQFWRLGT